MAAVLARIEHVVVVDLDIVRDQLPATSPDSMNRCENDAAISTFDLVTSRSMRNVGAARKALLLFVQSGSAY